jgi:hypothetical protein
MAHHCPLTIGRQQQRIRIEGDVVGVVVMIELCFVWFLHFRLKQQIVCRRGQWMSHSAAVMFASSMSMTA